MTPRTLWIGSYPPAGIGTPAGRGEGLYRLDLDPATSALSEPRLAVEAPAPSFVVRHPTAPVLYATDEEEEGRVAAFRVSDDGLRPLGSASSGGRFPCHLLVHGGRLHVANYGDGALGVLPLAADGTFASDRPTVLAHAGAGPVTERQEGPHAHFVVRAPGGHLLVVDLGTDEVRRYRATPAGPVPAGIAARLPPGTGPRHLVFGAGRSGPAAYLVGELDATVRVLAWDASTDTGELVQTLPAVGTGPSRDGSEHAPSHLALDGDELVVGVRGAGLLSRFTVRPDGLLAHRADQPLPGPVPRHLAVVGPWTVVAEQVPGAVTVLDRDGAVASSRAVASAACVLPAW